MKVIFVATALFALFVVVSAGPTISDDFEATVEMFETHGDHHRRFEGRLVESFSLKKQRINAFTPHEHGGEFEFLRLYPTKEEYETHNGTCRHRSFNLTMHPAFAWASDATKSNHPCHSKGRHGEVGVQYEKDATFQNEHIQAVLCVDKAETEPYWVDFSVVGKPDQRLVNFHNFKPFVPNPAEEFRVPTQCR